MSDRPIKAPLRAVALAAGVLMAMGGTLAVGAHFSSQDPQSAPVSEREELVPDDERTPPTASPNTIPDPNSEEAVRGAFLVAVHSYLPDARVIDDDTLVVEGERLCLDLDHYDIADADYLAAGVISFSASSASPISDVAAATVIELSREYFCPEIPQRVLIADLSLPSADWVAQAPMPTVIEAALSDQT